MRILLSWRVSLSQLSGVSIRAAVSSAFQLHAASGGTEVISIWEDISANRSVRPKLGSKNSYVCLEFFTWFRIRSDACGDARIPVDDAVFSIVIAGVTGISIGKSSVT